MKDLLVGVKKGVDETMERQGDDENDRDGVRTLFGQIGNPPFMHSKGDLQGQKRNKTYLVEVYC